MKKIISVICIIAVTACIALPLVSCSRRKKVVADRFNEIYAVEENGTNDTLSFSEGIYEEEYNGNTYTGTYTASGSKLYLFPYGKKYQYEFNVEFTEKGDVSRFFNDSRSFAVEKNKKK